MFSVYDLTLEFIFYNTIERLRLVHCLMTGKNVYTNNGQSPRKLFPEKSGSEQTRIGYARKGFEHTHSVSYGV